MEILMFSILENFNAFIGSPPSNLASYYGNFNAFYLGKF